MQQLPGFRWALLECGSDDRRQQAVATSNNTPLVRLCRYYLACLAKDLDRNVSEFATSKYGKPDHAELSCLPFAADVSEGLWDSAGVRRVLGKIRQ